jgi:hypothetical protein
MPVGTSRWTSSHLKRNSNSSAQRFKGLLPICLVRALASALDARGNIGNVSLVVAEATEVALGARRGGCGEAIFGALGCAGLRVGEDACEGDDGDDES